MRRQHRAGHFHLDSHSGVDGFVAALRINLSVRELHFTVAIRLREVRDEYPRDGLRAA